MEKKTKIMVVDDDMTLCTMLKESLISCGCDCKSAPNGKTALELLKSEPFDVMIADIVMPGMDGLELTETARRHTPSLPVIVMTGFSEDDSYDRAIAAGAADFIKKPFIVKELLVRIDRILRDGKILSEIRQREEELKAISREMIAGVQDEALKRVSALEEEIKTLKQRLSYNA